MNDAAAKVDSCLWQIGDIVKVVEEWESEQAKQAASLSRAPDREGAKSMSDRLTKIALVAIALGLWVNIAVTLLHPTPLRAQDATLGLQIANIERDVGGMYNGLCPNSKICLDISN